MKQVLKWLKIAAGVVLLGLAIYGVWYLAKTYSSPVAQSVAVSASTSPSSSAALEAVTPQPNIVFSSAATDAQTEPESAEESTPSFAGCGRWIVSDCGEVSQCTVAQMIAGPKVDGCTDDSASLDPSKADATLEIDCRKPGQSWNDVFRKGGTFDPVQVRDTNALFDLCHCECVKLESSSRDWNAVK